MEKVNQERNQFSKKLLAILIIFCMTFANFALVGSNLAIAAEENLEKQETLKKGDNIEFDAFFKDEKEETHTKALEVKDVQTLYVKVNVKDKVTIPEATIKIENPNFTIREDGLVDHRYVKEVNTETNEIKLKNISSNNDVTLEVPITFKKEESTTEEYFNQETTITLEGKYGDINQKQKDLEGKVSVKPQWTSDATITSSQTIEKYFSLGEKGTLIEQQIKTQIEDRTLPIKAQILETVAPTLGSEKPQNVTVLVNGEHLDEDNVQYDNQSGNVEISYEATKDEQGKIKWNNSLVQYNIIYRYSNAAPVEPTTVGLHTTIETVPLTKTSAISKEDASEQLVNPIGNIATVETILKGDLYKGFLYDNEAKEIEYEEENQVTVSYKEEIGNVKLRTNNNIYLDENNAGIVAGTNIRYTQTTINKAEMINLLGEQGSINIIRANGEIVQTITNETEENEEGNIVINYGTEERDLQFEATAPQSEGILKIINRKALTGALGQPREVIKRIKKLLVTPEVETTLSKESSIAEIEMKETTSEAKIEVSRDNLSTVETNKNVEIKATLQSNSVNQDLYRNPAMLIEFPSDVKVVKVNSINKLYGDEFTEVRPAQAEIDGKQMIRIDLMGEQTQHKETGVEGTVINIDADIDVDMKATNKQDEIKMSFVNTKANQYKDGAQQGTAIAPIEIVSPQSLITTNDIEALQVETIGQDEEVSKTLQVNQPAQVFTVSQDIINNNETKINDVKVMGTFGTNGEVQIGDQRYTNNIQSNLLTALNIQANDANKIKVYYTENTDATEDIEDAQNGWRENITNVAGAKKYLVQLTDMEAAERLNLSYNIEVPENLQYQQQMYQGYSATYVKEGVESIEQADATTIQLQTGEGPQVKTSLIGKVGADTLSENAEVKRGEIIRYDVQVQNSGNEDLTGVTVEAGVPENTVLLNANHREDEVQTREITIGDIKVGETKTVTYEVKVKDDAQIGQSVVATAKVKYGDMVENVKSVTATVSEAANDLQINIDYAPGEAENVIMEGNRVGIFAEIKNTTERTLKNVEVKWNMPEEFEITSMDIDEGMENNEGTVIIDEIQAEQEKSFYMYFKVNEFNEDKQVSVSAMVQCNNEEYRSNSYNFRLVAKTKPDIKLSSAMENQYVKSGDVITYTIEVKNNNSIPQEELIVKDDLPSSVTLKSASITHGNGETEQIEIDNGNGFTKNILLEAGEEKIITLEAMVNYYGTIEEDIQIVNKASITTLTGLELNQTNEIINTIEAINQGGGEIPGGGDEPTPGGNTTPGGNVSPEENIVPGGEIPGGEDIPGNQDQPEQEARKINGIAWLDTNENGMQDDEEEIISGMTVRLLNAQTNEFAKDINGNEVQAITDDTGAYVLEDVPQGDYIVLFEYDSTQYKITEYQKEGTPESKNSKAISKSLNIDGEERLYGVTDIISIINSSIANINIGLIKTGTFDLSLDKYISKITVNTAGEVKTYNYNNETLAKVELSASKMENSNVIIEYNIVVTNNGEVAGYAKEIEDQIPSDVTFSQELNGDWQQQGTKLVSNSLENSIIIPGESKTVKLVLTKTMSKTNTGIVTNTAEISDSYNSDGVEDTNSTPGNGNQNEDDYGSADVIISIKTGGVATYTTLILLMSIIFAVAIYTIKQDVELKEIEKGIY